ncbi:MAG: DMT family transporter [Paracoccaceae bacterium]
MGNLRGSVLMVLSMAGFAIEDMFIKQMAGALPVGQILVLLGAGGAVIFAATAWLRGDRIFSRDILNGAVVWRLLGEVVGTIGFVTALALTPISTASAILQAVPLAITLGAALFLGETVGWRRWSAILVGFLGVLLIIRPGLDGFVPASLFAVQGVVGLAIRDLATRKVPASITSVQLSTYAFASLVPTGFAMLAVLGQPMQTPAPTDLARLAAALAIGVVAYTAVVAATRIGEVAVVAPFRYSRIIFALIVGFVVFSERPDALTLGGAAIIVGSGIYTLLREARVRRSARRASLAAPSGV